MCIRDSATSRPWLGTLRGGLPLRCCDPRRRMPARSGTARRVLVRSLGGAPNVRASPARRHSTPPAQGLTVASLPPIVAYNGDNAGRSEEIPPRQSIDDSGHQCGDIQIARDSRTCSRATRPRRTLAMIWPDVLVHTKGLGSSLLWAM